MDKNKTIIHKDKIEIIVTSRVFGVKSVFVDIDDYEKLLKGKNIHVRRGHKAIYAVMNVYYNGKSRPRDIHREIMGNPKCEIDHIDQNGLNNCKSNLRLATRGQNSVNIALLSNNKSGFKGVSYNKKAKKWEAYITINKKRKHAGLYNTPEEAAKKYNELAMFHFGDFSKLNNVPDSINPKKSLKKSETTGYRGVYLTKRKTMTVYQAAIFIGNKKIHIGFYKTPKEAAFAYNETAIKLKGNDAVLNII